MNGRKVKALRSLRKMPEDGIESIVKKHVEMNVAHPFMEGNGRATRIWHDLILKKNLHTCTDWSEINKREYLETMRESSIDPSHILGLIKDVQTPQIDDRGIFMKALTNRIIMSKSMNSR